MRERDRWWVLFLLVLTVIPPVELKRGGVSVGRSRGTSASRTSSGGKVFGGGNSGNAYGRETHYGGSRTHHNTNTGNTGWNNNHNNYNPNTNYNRNQNTGGGGLFNKGGSNNGGWGNQAHTSSNAYGRSMGGYGGYGGGHKYSKSGVGSFVRSNQFKNAIVGAAAGYLTYQAGKAIIRSMAGPMMWNNRPYYWGQSYWRPQHSSTRMCRMPMEQNDPQFGNIYFQDNTRPREIVWGCGAYEYCCGYECCRGGDSMAPAPIYTGFGYWWYRIKVLFMCIITLAILTTCCICVGRRIM